MTSIPPDVAAVAEQIMERIAKVHPWKGNCVADISAAILAERERCAGIAERSVGDTYQTEIMAEHIAKSIRGEEA